MRGRQEPGREARQCRTPEAAYQPHLTIFARRSLPGFSEGNATLNILGFVPGSSLYVFQLLV